MICERNGRLEGGALWTLILCVSAYALWFNPRVAVAQTLEYEVKAAFLLNFTKFVDWPPSAFDDAAAPLTICILGKDPFGRALDQIVTGEDVSGHRLAVRRLTEPPRPHSCQAIYFGADQKDVPRILKGLADGVLTVGEGESFLRDGGMIAFVVENRRVRFDVDQSSAERADLNLSSRLLSVARSVQK